MKLKFKIKKNGSNRSQAVKFDLLDLFKFFHRLSSLDVWLILIRHTN